MDDSNEWPDSRRWWSLREVRIGSTPVLDLPKMHKQKVQGAIEQHKPYSAATRLNRSSLVEYPFHNLIYKKGRDFIPEIARSWLVLSTRVYQATTSVHFLLTAGTHQSCIATLNCYLEYLIAIL